jgi:hypothetical protein
MACFRAHLVLPCWLRLGDLSIRRGEQKLHEALEIIEGGWAGYHLSRLLHICDGTPAYGFESTI